MERPKEPLALRVKDLRVIGTPSGASLIEDIELAVRPGEILGLVGESASGKSTLGLALLQYCKRGTARAGGRIVIAGNDLGTLSQAETRHLRGRTVAYIPQSPASALNPALRIRTQLREGLDRRDERADERVREVLREVALPDDEGFLRRYPHQLSGGQQQRVAIAMAFVAKPRLIVLDEPTTGLDVTTQKHVLDTVRRMCASYGAAALYISHDMAVVAELADRIAVMYSGRIVESGPARAVIRFPRHPYSRRLLLAVPDLAGERPMVGIPGHAPSPLHRPEGCAFAPRCPLAVDHCREVAPPTKAVPGQPGAPRPLLPGRGRGRRDGGGAAPRPDHRRRPREGVRPRPRGEGSERPVRQSAGAREGEPHDRGRAVRRAARRVGLRQDHDVAQPGRAAPQLRGRGAAGR